ncbi:MAG: phosphotransferase family protein [Solirubrobacteraceae bacterium]
MLDRSQLATLLPRALAAADPALAGATVRAVERMPGGLSRAMFRFELETGCGSRAYVLRADPPAGRSITTDRRREWAVLRWLTDGKAVPTPAGRWYLPASGPLGVDALVMNFEAAPPLVAAPLADDAAAEALADKLADLAASIHAVALDDAPPELQRPASWDEYVSKAEAAVASQEREHGQAVPVLRYLSRWLSAHRPAPAPLRLVHGDFQAPNILIDSGGKLRIVDWELARIGDPREDLGIFAFLSETIPPDLIRRDPEAFCDRYCALSGLGRDVVTPESLTYFGVLGLMTGALHLLPEIDRVQRGEAAGILPSFWPRALAMLLQSTLGAVLAGRPALDGAR